MFKIFNESIEVQFNISPFEITSIKNDTVEIIYQKTSLWDKSWPILFPVCGAVNEKLTHKNKELGLTRHGFFREIKDWKILEQNQNSISLEYFSKEEFIDVYPFRFKLNIDLFLSDKVFSFNIKVSNLEDEEMYFSLGHHPGFIFNKNSRVDLIKEDLFTDQFEKGLVSNLKKEIKIKDINISNLDFSNGKSYMTNNFNKEEIYFENGKVNFNIMANDFKDLVIWRESNECDFICIENWNGIPDLLNKESFELKDKEGIMKLQKDEQKDFLFEIKF
ncbi:hypothetical protein [Spiroplasma sp. BIUS-1]|uniref:aldose epimerase family protein n=1 Tax=Spiroplasma sp. BIUS-1 TaxID=216964 RepID=UPI001397FD6E|nr:hypothetical protein [Spiroplasma sp. BIUS-1]QHX36474.1 aldose 1-epimerase [Spiroplasma sp. BIUS-1]